jgi:ubiquinone/menaquinone biosynthesis C-methylase UbiE
MGKLRNYVTPLHQSTVRNYLARMQDEKIHCMQIAKQYEDDYWDGDRRYGYGGYKYIPGRWKSVAEELIKNYNLKSDSKVLDVGCGKGFLLYEMKLLIPKLNINGIDVSEHGLRNAKKEVKPFLKKHKAQDSLPFDDDEFDLVISLGTIHNLRLFDLEKSLKEIERVGKQGYIMLESYRNERELFNLQCWALTAESFFDEEEWIWLYKHFNYTGDYEFIYF